MAADKLALRSVPRGIGGWLLLYVILAVLGMVMMLVSLVQDIRFAMTEPAVLPAQIVITLLSAGWYVLYIRALYHLVLLHAGAVPRIKKMIVGTPLLNAVIPFIFAVVVVLTVPGVPLAFILGEVYTPEMLGNIIGSGFMAVIWYRYYCVSLRVQNTWPETGENGASPS